jgi:hypothetical protein
MPGAAKCPLKAVARRYANRCPVFRTGKVDIARQGDGLSAEIVGSGN